MPAPPYTIAYPIAGSTIQNGASPKSGLFINRSKIWPTTLQSWPVRSAWRTNPSNTQSDRGSNNGLEPSGSASMAGKRPIIAVTGPDRGGWPAWICTRLAVWRAGGKALRLRPKVFPPDVPLPAYQGLILGGGADIEAAKAGIQIDQLLPPKELKKDGDSQLLAWLFAPLLLLVRGVLAIHHAEVDELRDAFEERCLQQALSAGQPILGICRGAQLINVHFGGTLHAELSGFYGESGNPASVYPRKQVTIQAGSQLQHILNQDTLLVNSLHKQAIKQLGQGVQITATDKAGVIQAIESGTHNWILGVQWHPEFLPTLHKHQRLFRALIARAQR
ncbi:MAG: gamma-glutamyl-gamma-aminobutyrate hydrolase family protein [Puniceicoccaceae bacterium]|nr:MAG: gamma-glutamyl-gamma-aminobutyrate hydrolase family protein [Puniceicoccaceae bacterium]